MNINTTITTSNPYTGTILTMSNSELQSMFNKHIIVEFNLNLIVTSQYAFMIYFADNFQSILLDMPNDSRFDKNVNMKIYVNTSQHAYVNEQNPTIEVGKSIEVVADAGAELYSYNLFSNYNQLSIRAVQERQSSSTIEGSISAKILGFEYLTSN